MSERAPKVEVTEPLYRALKRQVAETTWITGDQTTLPRDIVESFKREREACERAVRAYEEHQGHK